MNYTKQRLLPFLAFLALVGNAGASGEPQGKRWQFDVSLDGKRIGYHTFEVQQDGDKQVLTTEARFDVKFLFITAFRYRHENTEIWNDSCLSSIDAATDSNGKELAVRGTAMDDAFALQRTGGETMLPSCVQSFAYWKPEVLESSRLLNSQTGVYEDVTVSREGSEQVPVADEMVEAVRYRLSAEAGDITLWYSAADNTWLGLEAPAKGGRTIRYQAVDVPATADSEQLVARDG